MIISDKTWMALPSLSHIQFNYRMKREMISTSCETITLWKHDHTKSKGVVSATMAIFSWFLQNIAISEVKYALEIIKRVYFKGMTILIFEIQSKFLILKNNLTEIKISLLKHH